MKAIELFNVIGDDIEEEVIILDHQEELKICCVKWNHELKRIEINVATSEELEEARNRIRRTMIHSVKDKE